MSVQSVMPSNHFVLCHPLLFLPSVFPSLSLFFKVFFSVYYLFGASVILVSFHIWSFLQLPDHILPFILRRDITKVIRSCGTYRVHNRNLPNVPSARKLSLLHFQCLLWVSNPENRWINKIDMVLDVGEVTVQWQTQKVNNDTNELPFFCSAVLKWLFLSQSVGQWRPKRSSFPGVFAFW